MTAARAGRRAHPRYRLLAGRLRRSTRSARFITAVTWAGYLALTAGVVLIALAVADDSSASRWAVAAAATALCAAALVGAARRLSRSRAEHLRRYRALLSWTRRRRRHDPQR